MNLSTKYVFLTLIATCTIQGTVFSMECPTSIPEKTEQYHPYYPVFVIQKNEDIICEDLASTQNPKAINQLEAQTLEALLNQDFYNILNLLSIATETLSPSIFNNFFNTIWKTIKSDRKLTNYLLHYAYTTKNTLLVQKIFRCLPSPTCE